MMTKTVTTIKPVFHCHRYQPKTILPTTITPKRTKTVINNNKLDLTVITHKALWKNRCSIQTRQVKPLFTCTIINRNTFPIIAIILGQQQICPTLTTTKTAIYLQLRKAFCGNSKFLTNFILDCSADGRKGISYSLLTTWFASSDLHLRWAAPKWESSSTR